MGMKKKQAKVMKVSDDQCLDQLVLWFRQKRSEGVRISGPLLCEKALELRKILLTR